MKTKILITGCHGYIGSQLYHHLSKRFDVHGIDTGTYGCFSSFGHVGNHNYLTKQELAPYDVIIILSGRSSVQSCPDSAVLEVCRDNINSIKDIFRNTNSSQLVIYASSGSLCNGRQNCTEEYTCYPTINWYDYSKVGLENIHKNQYWARDIVGLRFGTVFGHSENFRNDTIFNKFFLQCEEGQDLVVNFPDTNRSFLAMEDLVAGIEAVVDCPTRGIFNLASISRDFGSLAEDFADYYEPVQETTVIYSKTGKNNYDFSLNIDKFKKTFNFTPSVQSVRDGLNIMVKKFQENQPIYCGGRV